MVIQGKKMEDEFSLFDYSVKVPFSPLKSLLQEIVVKNAI